MSVQITDLNDAFGKALLQQFFEPVLIGRGPNGEGHYASSGVALLAQQLYKDHSQRIMAEVWERLDMDDLATRIADLVIKELTRVPGAYERSNVHQEDLAKRVREIAAQQLGQRVVDQMDVHLGTRELPTSEETR